MKSGTGSTVLVSVLFTALLVGIAPALQADDRERCSNSIAAGDWGYTTAGTRLGIGAVASVGSFTSDRDGNFTGKQTVSFNGVPAVEQISGTITVNPDCTGSVVVNVVSPILNRMTPLDLVWVDGMNEVRGIFTSAQTIVTLDGKKIHSRHDD